MLESSMLAGSQSVVAWLWKPWMCVSTRPGATVAPGYSTMSHAGASADHEPNTPSSMVRYPPCMVAPGSTNLSAEMANFIANSSRKVKLR